MSRQKMFKIILMVDEPDMKSLLLFFWKLLSFQNRMRTFAPWYWNLSPAARYLTWVFNILMLFESMVYKWILVYIFCLKSIGLSLSDEASKTKFLNHVLKELNNFRYLWKFEPDIPNSFGEILFANPTIYKEWVSSWTFCHPVILQFLKGHSQLMHMRIKYHFLVDLHVTRRAWNKSVSGRQSWTTSAHVQRRERSGI